jgi:hypothetical protein
VSAEGAGTPGGVSYEVVVGGSPSPAVLAALRLRTAMVPRHVVVVVTAEDGDLVDILATLAVPGVEVESVRVMPTHS